MSPKRTSALQRSSARLHSALPSSGLCKDVLWSLHGFELRGILELLASLCAKAPIRRELVLVFMHASSIPTLAAGGAAQHICPKKALKKPPHGVGVGGTSQGF